MAQYRCYYAQYIFRCYKVTALHGGYPRGRAYLVKKLLKDLTGFTAWKTYAYFLGGAPALNTATNVALRPLDDTSSKLKEEARTDRNTVIGFHIVLLVVCAWSGYLVQYLVLWILPLVTVVQAILRLRAIAERRRRSRRSRRSRSTCRRPPTQT